MRTGELTHLVLMRYATKQYTPGDKYIAMTQVASSTGGAASIADVMVLGAWPSSGNELQGFEVKVSRSDWLNELKNPQKNIETKKYCNQWWLVISDASYVKEGELPDDWGMMAIVKGSLEVVVKAPKLEPEPIPNNFIACLMRANQSETIPLDVHRDKLKDAKLDAAAAEKKKTADLKEYLNYLHKEIGIKIEYKAKSYGQEKAWNGFIRGHHKEPHEIVRAVSEAANGDSTDALQALNRIKEKAQDIIKFIDGEKDYVY